MDNECKGSVKLDINFLEYPIWSVDIKSTQNKFVIRKGKGVYTIKSVEGLANSSDLFILYNILDIAQCDKTFSRNVKISRCALARRVTGRKNVGAWDYKVIKKSLAKWTSMYISFEGIFFEGDSYTERLFGIIDDVKIDRRERSLDIKINEQFIEQLQESNFYIYLKLNKMRSLKKPISMRLYEILFKSFKSGNTFYIKNDNLAEKLTLSKRKNAKSYYLSDVKTKLKPAVNEINKNTDLNVSYEVDRKKKVIKFKQERNITPLEKELLDIGFKGARKITSSYSKDKIQEKIKLMKKSKADIHNPTGWLTAALKEDWDHTILEKQQKEQEEVEEKRKQKFKAQQREQEQQDLDKEFRQWLTEEAERRLNQSENKADIEKQCEQYVAEQRDKNKPYSAPDWAYRDKFLKDNFLTEEDRDFNRWKREIKQIKSA